jgi:ribosome assembly protein 1
LIVSLQCNVTLLPREINARDPRLTLQAALRRWLPLSDAVLRMIIRTVPDPIVAQQQRLFTLLPGVSEQVSISQQGAGGPVSAPASTNQSPPDFSAAALPLAVALEPRTEEVHEKVEHSCAAVQASIAQCCNKPEAPVVVFVSKMVPVRVAELSQRDIAMVNARMAHVAVQSGATEEGVPAPQLKSDGEVFIALGRVFCGILQRNSTLYVLGSKYDPHSGARVGTDVNADISGAEQSQQLVGLTPLPQGVTMGLYIMLGPSVVPVEQVPAGNIVGILGLSEFILKTATLSSTWAAHPMTSITFQSKPMLKVAVEPTSHMDLRRLEGGLQQLHQFDPVVEVGIDKDTGQNTMTCLGELHLEQCVKALTERFAK